MQGFVGSAKASIDSVDAACDQVGNSRRLQDVLRAVLAVGNALNTGTARASADGVKLDSLMKLADVKVLSLCPFAVCFLVCPPDTTVQWSGASQQVLSANYLSALYLQHC